MAGTQNIGEASDNPVAINVTAMVDVIFCLCLFFMCSLHFKQLEGKVEAWLPRKDGNQPQVVERPPVLEEIRVLLRWDPDSSQTIRKVGKRSPVSGDQELTQVTQLQLCRKFLGVDFSISSPDKQFFYLAAM